MRPILYPESETNFTTNGLGRLNPLMCHVTKERNGQYDLEMDIRIDDRHYADLKEYRIIYAPHDNTNLCQPFEICKITRPIDGVVTVFANHVYYRTAKTTVMPCTAQSCSAAMSAISSNIAGTSQFTLSTDISGSGTFTVEKPEKMRDLLGGIRGSLLDVYGGEYVFDHFNIILKSAAGSEKNVTLRYGKNITDIKKTTDSSNIWTGIAPFWLGTDGNSTSLVTLPEKAVYSTEEPNYQYKMVIPMDFSDGFTGKPTEAQLRAKAEAYVQNNAPTGIPSTIDVSFVQLWETEEYRNIANLERVNLCDTITIEHEALGVSNKAKIVRTVYDVLNERYVEMTIGDVRTSLGDTIAAAAEAVKEVTVSKSALQAALEAAAKLINGGLGGHVVINTDSDGHPNEILIMDTDNINTAVNVLRLNMLGIGFSVNGYNGPFTSAWTIDGHFCADFITAGHLNANYIQGGTLAMGGANNGNGVIEIYDASGTLIGRWDSEGLKVYRGLIQGPDIVAGGLNNSNGTIVVKDANGNQIGKWDKDGAVITGSLKMLGDTTFCTIGNTPTYVDYVVEGLVQRTLENLQYVIPYDSNGHVRAIKTFVKVDAGSIQEILAIAGTVAQRLVVITDGSYLPELSTSSDNNKIRGYKERVSHNSTNGSIYELKPLPGGGHDTGLEIYKNHVKLGKFTCDGEGRIGANRELDIPPNSSSATIDGNTIAYASSSSKRYKHDINKSLTGDRDQRNLLKLPVAEFVFNDDHHAQYADMKGKIIPGIIAEDVEEIYPSAVIHNERGEVESWDERRIIPGMLALIQEQQRTIEALTARIKALERRYGNDNA